MATGRDRTKHYMTRGEWFVDPDDVTGTNGQGLGHTVSGFEVDVGEQVIEDSDDEDGANINQVYYAGNQVRLRSVLKTWDPLVLAKLFPNQYEATDELIQIPGDRAPGDSILSESVRLVFVPDNPFNKTADTGKDPTLVAMKAMIKHPEGDHVPFSNTELRKITIEALCVEDKAIGSGADEYKFRTLGIGPVDRLSLP